MAFVNFEKLLQKYFENAEQFTVVPRIVFLDVDVHTLNGFLMRDRPGTEIHEKILTAWPYAFFLSTSQSADGTK